MAGACSVLPPSSPLQSPGPLGAGPWLPPPCSPPVYADVAWSQHRHLQDTPLPRTESAPVWSPLFCSLVSTSGANLISSLPPHTRAHTQGHSVTCTRKPTLTLRPWGAVAVPSLPVLPLWPVPTALGHSWAQAPSAGSARSCRSAAGFTPRGLAAPCDPYPCDLTEGTWELSAQYPETTA